MAKKAKEKLPKAPKSDWGALLGFFKKVKLSWGLIAITLAVSIASMFFALMAQMYTAGLFGGDLSTGAILAAVAVIGIQFLISGASNVASMFATARSVRAIRSAVWRRMMGVETEFYRTHGPDTLLSAVTADATALVSSIMLLASTVASLFYLVFAFQALSGFNIKLAASLLVMLPLYVIYAAVIGRFHYRVAYGIQDQVGRLTGFLADRVRNLGLIKSFATEDREAENGKLAIDRLYRAKVEQIIVNSADVAVMMLEMAISTVVAVVWASVLLRNGEITLEAWLAYYMMNESLNNAIRQITNVWPRIKAVQGYASRLSALVEAPQEDTTGGAPFANGDLKLQGVGFAYGDKTVLHDVDLTIPAGKVTAIVGLSGGGKTTTLNLIERLYKPTQGTITLNGTDISALSLPDYRGHLAYVKQDSETFSGTYREILTYGVARPVADDAVMKAAELVGMAEHIQAQPDGLDSRVAVWGTSLSGGQRQRLVIARELLKDADILLFDEPTNALDARTAREVLDTITRLFAGKTLVIITHDLALIRDADQIAVVENGTVADCGAHGALVERCPFYQELVAEQSFQEVYGNA